jgi:hypothetical protein
MVFIDGNTASERIIRAATPDDVDFSLTAIPRDTVLVPGETSELQVDDRLIMQSTTATVKHEWDVIPAVTVDDPFKIYADFSSSNEAVATVDENGDVSRVADGYANIMLSTPKLSRSVRVHMWVEDGGTTITEFVGYAEGSLAKECTDAVDSRIAGLTPATAKPIFTTQNHAGSVYVRNADCWATDVDLTCISPWNSTGGNKRAGTLISPRHIIFAEHYPIGVSATVRFVTADNVVVERTVTAVQNVGPANAEDNYASDFCIGLLDSDVPETITFAKVLPADCGDYLPSMIPITSADWVLPALYLDQEEKALVTSWWGTVPQALTRVLTEKVSFRVPSDATQLSFFEDIIDGDSGNPQFLIIGGELVLLGTWTYGTSFLAGSGPFTTYWADEINAAMTTLGGGYQLTEVDLSGFPTY